MGNNFVNYSYIYIFVKNKNNFFFLLIYFFLMENLMKMMTIIVWGLYDENSQSYEFSKKNQILKNKKINFFFFFLTKFFPLTCLKSDRFPPQKKTKNKLFTNFFFSTLKIHNRMSFLFFCFGRGGNLSPC